MGSIDRNGVIRMMRQLATDYGLAIVDAERFDMHQIHLARARAAIRALLERPTLSERQLAVELLAEMEATGSAHVPRPPSDPELRGS